MPGIRETRKKLQRSVLYIVQCEKAEAAFHELTLLKQTVDSQVRLLGEKLNLLEECRDAANTEEADQQPSEVAKAAHHGYSEIYGQE